MKRSVAGVCLALVLLLLSGAALNDAYQETVGPSPAYREAAAILEPFIEREMRSKGIPAISIALVAGNDVVWARGFGFADPEKRLPASARTIYRVGSVSKLFTDIGVMQLVEQAKLDLDAPVARYLPDFKPANSSGTGITLRMLTAHMSGLTREPPVGHYFDDTGSSLAATVASLNRTSLVYPPGTHTKYSNAGIAVLGYILEKTQGESFYPYLERAVLEPMGLKDSAFRPLPALERSLAQAFMWTYDGRRFAAPTFQLGMGPCGSMYSTVLDLGRFESILFNGGATPEGNQVLQRATLEKMWQPQYAKPGQKTGYGIGFNIGELDGHRTLGHGGAIYGFATTLSMLPDDRLGAIVIGTLDAANSVTDRIAAAALRLMLAGRQKQPLAVPEAGVELAPGLAAGLQGRYFSGDTGVDLHEFNGKLFYSALRGGARGEVRSLGKTLIVDSPLSYGPALTPLDGNRLLVGKDTLTRAPSARFSRLRPEWQGLIGEYGWDYNTLYILEKNGRLTTLIEWFFEYPLQQVSRDVYRFPAYGLYDGQEIVFERDPSGQATVATAGTVTFKRRAGAGGSAAESFKIEPVRPVEELRLEAAAAKPPAETGEFRKPDLVELRTLDPSIRYEIRYATSNNFMGAPFYSSAHAFLQRPAAEAVARAARKLREHGYGLLIHDAYRPWYVTRMFWDGTPEDKHIFVANPAQGSRHNRGCAVDLTLYDLKTGETAVMTGGYDEMSERSYADYPGGTDLQRWQRDLLRRTLQEEGFTVYDFEWWHFDYKDWKQYPILNLTFEQLAK